LDKQKVKEALQLIENALNDEEFLVWVRENEEDLDNEYETYKLNCYETGEEPDDFYTWALWYYVNTDTSKTQTRDTSHISSCKELNCDYYERFGTCSCFKWCPYCNEETKHIDKVCTKCGHKNE